MKESGGRPVAENFRYASDNNPQWLTPAEFAKILAHEAIEI
jgi:hypothetical protein